MWKFVAQRSAAAQPLPFGLLLELPELLPHRAGLGMPGTAKPPEQAAMRG